LILALTAFQVLPINYAGLGNPSQHGVACRRGLAPSFGVLGIGGLISLALGSFFSSTRRIRISSWIGRLSLPPSHAGRFVLTVSYLVFRSQKSKPTLGLEGRRRSRRGAQQAQSGQTDLRARRILNAQADGEIDVGEKVEVLGYEGMNLKVRRSSERSVKES
jgi:membrane-bound serine protease (ClpP class)